MKQNYEAIIFDLGGVILNIDYQKTIQAFVNLGISDFDTLYTQAKQNDLFDDIEIGAISESEFYDEMRSLSGLKLDDHEIRDAWNSMLLDLPQERISLLKKIADKVPIFLLSNTNEIHLKAFQHTIQSAFGQANLLEDIFVETFYSHLIRARKPNPEAFQLILDKYDLKPQNTLFIDDSIQHIHGAKTVGLKAHHLANDDITSLFN